MSSFPSKIKGVCSRIKSEIPICSENMQFGKKEAYWTFLNNVLPITFVVKKHMSVLNTFFSEFLKEEIAAVNNASDDEEKSFKGKIPVWFCWFAGLESAPELIKTCYNRLVNFLPANTELVLLTDNNIESYIDLPEYVIEKRKSHNMTEAAYSDVVRSCLLYQYGGLWIDATVFVSKQISEDFFEQRAYTLKSSEPSLYLDEPSQGRWCTFLWYVHPHTKLMCFIKNAFLKYWETYDKVIEYILPDYFYLCAYNSVVGVKEMIDEIPVETDDFWYALNHQNTEYSDELYEDMLEKSRFHKLTYRRKFLSETDEGKATLWKKIVRGGKEKL